MSRLSTLARAASSYFRRTGRTTTDSTDESSPAPSLLGQLASTFTRSRQPHRPNFPRPPQPPGDWMLSEQGAPPRVPPVPPPFVPPPQRTTGNAPDQDDWDDDRDRFDNITILGRDKSYDADDWAEVHDRMRLVNSSNVYGYYYQLESRTSGILYVQYLDYTPRSLGGTGQRGGPGPVYAYYSIPLRKYREFEAMAATTAGGAVWTYCRVPGSVFEHQHTYCLIQTSGEYVPRKVTAMGFKRRNVAAIGIGRRNRRYRDGGGARLQLDDYTHTQQDGTRGWPRRGTPNRGGPNRAN